MEKLWAPWRMAYITAAVKEGECLFCAKAACTEDRENLILWRGKTCLVIMNLYPYNNGHVMVVPYRHIESPGELTPEESAELFHLAGKTIEVLDQVAAPHGYNLGINIGRVAGAGVLGHIHLHLVPRWNGDTNFMPVLGETKVVSELVLDTYDRLQPVLTELLKI